MYDNEKGEILQKEGISCNITLLFSLIQAAGAHILDLVITFYTYLNNILFIL